MQSYRHSGTESRERLEGRKAITAVSLKNVVCGKKKMLGIVSAAFVMRTCKEKWNEVRDPVLVAC